jgi:hypothetical protein
MPLASNTALEALIEHAAAFSSKNNERYAETLSLPFVHLWQDGEILRYGKPGDIDLFKHYARAGIDAERFGHTELDAAELILDWEHLKAFHAIFTRYAREGGATGRSEAIWVAIRTGECWKIKLRIGAERIKQPGKPS